MMWLMLLVFAMPSEMVDNSTRTSYKTQTSLIGMEWLYSFSIGSLLSSPTLATMLTLVCIVTVGYEWQKNHWPKKIEHFAKGKHPVVSGNYRMEIYAQILCKFLYSVLASRCDGIGFFCGYATLLSTLVLDIILDDKWIIDVNKVLYHRSMWNFRAIVELFCKIFKMVLFICVLWCSCVSIDFLMLLFCDIIIFAIASGCRLTTNITFHNEKVGAIVDTKIPPSKVSKTADKKVAFALLYDDWYKIIVKEYNLLYFTRDEAFTCETFSSVLRLLIKVILGQIHAYIRNHTGHDIEENYTSQDNDSYITSQDDDWVDERVWFDSYFVESIIYIMLAPLYLFYTISDSCTRNDRVVSLILFCISTCLHKSMREKCKRTVLEVIHKIRSSERGTIIDTTLKSLKLFILIMLFVVHDGVVIWILVVDILCTEVILSTLRLFCVTIVYIYDNDNKHKLVRVYKTSLLGSVVFHIDSELNGKLPMSLKPPCESKSE